MYSEIKDLITGNVSSILRIEDGANIPIDPANRNYAEYLAWLDAGNTPELNLPSIDILKTNKLAELSAARQAAERNFVFNGITIDLITETQSRIANAIQGMQLAQSSGVTNPTVAWQIVPGTFVTFDLPTIQAIGLGAYNHVQACFSNARTLTDTIMAASTHEGLDAIDIMAGWP